MPARLTAFALQTTLIATLTAGTAAWAQTSRYPITPDQRQTADQVAQAGVPLSDLAPDAPDSHLVKTGDTLWDISKIFLTSPWRWPELWGMNKSQIANPHLIYPGQLLVLVKRDGRARLELANSVGAGAASGGSDTLKLKPRMRISSLEDSAIAAIPLNLIEPFLTDAVVFDTDALAAAPRIVAAPEGRVLMSPGDSAYARGDFAGAIDFRIFRGANPLRDPTTKEVLGYEAPYVGRAELTRAEGTASGGKSLFGGDSTLPVPATLTVKTIKEEVVVGDRLSPVPQRPAVRYVPHAPDSALKGQVISLYGQGLQGGQHQIVSLNRGAADGMERGHVLALWRDGRIARDRTGDRTEEIKLPDERLGLLFVFEVYQRVSYALIIQARDPVLAGDRFSQP